ncbi:MAG: hypothetical protein CMK59_06560 [Proteobacteria bacterium]|nr:hypothetical protein [Pseudomonadota bacterium]
MIQSYIVWEIVVIWLLACGTTDNDLPKEAVESSVIDSQDSGLIETELMFSFVVLADPHIILSSDHVARLQTAVAWINQNVAERGIELVLVVGDVGWGDGLVVSEEELSKLDVPYAPIIGDNEVSYGSEQSFETAFSSAWSRLQSSFEDWNDGIGTVWNTQIEKESTFYNFAFTHKDVRFVCLDWASREEGPILSEIGYLHDFNGGSFNWFVDELRTLETQESNGVVLASHIPMILAPGGFAVDEVDQLSTVTQSYSDLIFANFSGHFHADAEIEMESLGFDVFITDATWDDDVTLRVVDVYRQGNAFLFEQELVLIPYVSQE